MLTRVAGRTHDDSGPSIAEMRHELTKPDGRDYFRLVPSSSYCAKCGTDKADWWLRTKQGSVCDKCL